MTDNPLVGRRHLLRSGAAALGGVAVGVGVGKCAWGDADSSAAVPARAAQPDGSQVVPFFGAHQAGIETTPQRFAAFVGLDLVQPVEPDSLGRLLWLLSDDAARLTQGRPSLADTEPDLAPQPARLTVTLGLGPRVLRSLGGGAASVGLEELPALRGDRLEERWGQTDLLVQLRGDDPLVLAHARRVVSRDTRELARIRWVQDGFRGGPLTPSGTGRNLMGQVDGTVNPAPGSDDFDRLVWIGDRAPAGVAGGTMLVLRRIKMLLDYWERVDRIGREFTIGRRLSDGSPLTGDNELDPVDLKALDSNGFPVIDAAAHVARAHPRTPQERFLRAPYNYLWDREGGTTQAGLLFAAYQADITRQFLPVQRRIATLDRLNQWVKPIGSAVYLLPPGCAQDGFVGDTLVGKDN